MIDMKKLLFIFAACALLCACGSKPEQKQCPYEGEEFVIHGSELQSPDSMEHYAALAAEGDARAQYVMAASYYCTGEVQPLPVGMPLQRRATSLPSKRASASASVEVKNKCYSYD